MTESEQYQIAIRANAHYSRRIIALIDEWKKSLEVVSWRYSAELIQFHDAEKYSIELIRDKINAVIFK